MTTDKSVASKIVDFIRSSGLSVGSHLPAQMLADRFRLSRSPVNEALQFLAEQGLLARERNRGYFTTVEFDQIPQSVLDSLGEEGPDFGASVYFKLAEDRLNGRLGDEVSESQLRKLYGLTAAQLQAVLGRISQEGWIHKRPGYGWEFSSMLTTPDSLLQSYRLRLALEPAALLEPGYRMPKAVLQRCRDVELQLLDGGIDTATADQLHDRGVSFHESLVEASGNAFFIETIKRVNRVRRLLSYRSMRDRKRYREHCHQHLELLDLIEKERYEDASNAMRLHLNATLNNLAKITDILSTPQKI